MSGTIFLPALSQCNARKHVSQKKHGSSGARLLPDVTHLQQNNAHHFCYHINNTTSLEPNINCQTSIRIQSSFSCPTHKVSVYRILSIIGCCKCTNIMHNVCMYESACLSGSMSHIVNSCPLTNLNGGLLHLHEADEAAVDWLTTYMALSTR